MQSLVLETWLLHNQRYGVSQNFHGGKGKHLVEIIPNWHPIYVNFAVALICVSALCFFIGYLFHKRTLGKELLITARWCLWLGAIAIIVAVIAGFIAFYSVAHDAASHIAMTTHRNWAIATLILVLIVTIWSSWLYLKNKFIGAWFVLVMIVTAILLMTTAWHGAEVVFRHGIGVQSLPKLIDEGHDHQHKQHDKTKIAPSTQQKTKAHDHGNHAH